MPGTQPPTTRRQERKSQRKRRPHGFAGRRMTPTETVDQAIEHCPDGGTRLPRGSATKMTLASPFGTWQAQRLNPLLACRQLLVSPQS